jgi:dTMP kinase
LLSLDPGLGRARSAERGVPADRLERQGDEFFARIAAGYATLALADPDRIRTIDASLPAPDVLAQALAAIADLV